MKENEDDELKFKDFQFLIKEDLPISITKESEIDIESGSHKVWFKGKSGSNVTFEGTWGKVKIKNQKKSFVKKITSMKVKKGTYEFYKKKNFKGEKATISKGDDWPTSTFEYKHIRSWRSV